MLLHLLLDEPYNSSCTHNNKRQGQTTVKLHFLVSFMFIQPHSLNLHNDDAMKIKMTRQAVTKRTSRRVVSANYQTGKEKLTTLTRKIKL